MMDRWQALETVCGYLRSGILRESCNPDESVSWEQLIEVASFHQVAPALAWSLRDKQMPEAVRDYFAAVAFLNRQRNDTLLTALERILTALNVIDIEPILLKGAAILVDDLYPDRSVRVVGDLDILISENDADRAFTALQNIGFISAPSSKLISPDHHHLPMQHDPESGAAVELHTALTNSKDDESVSVGWFRERARPIEFRGCRAALPDVTRNAAHLIHHGQVLHRFYWDQKVELRQLLDLAALRARSENDLDWDMIDRRFSAAGLGTVLATYLQVLESIFEQRIPKLSAMPNDEALKAIKHRETRSGFEVFFKHLTSELGVIRSELATMRIDRDYFRDERTKLLEHLQLMTEHRDMLLKDSTPLAEHREILRRELELMRTDRDDVRRELELMRADRNIFRDELVLMTNDRDLHRSLSEQIMRSKAWRIASSLLKIRQLLSARRAPP